MLVDNAHPNQHESTTEKKQEKDEENTNKGWFHKWKVHETGILFFISFYN